jgi:threonylcarbamoyladenosine tRNA methylthiotransferase MtaB
VRSRDPQSVYEQAKTLAQNGYQEIVLTGIHLSSYGAGEQFGLLELIRLVHDIPGIRRIRLGSLEPRIITPEFVKSLRDLPKVCPHFHLSLQSGCDATLARMNRKYTTAEYERSCQLLRQAYGDPAITTDVIVGFPGETEEEFDVTKEFLERIGFYEMHVFQYSKRRGTRAEKMPDQVPEPVKKERSGELLALAKRQSGQFRERMVGRETSVLLEEPLEIDGIAYMVGFTPEYVRLVTPLGTQNPADLANHIVTGRVGSAISDEIYLLHREE